MKKVLLCLLAVACAALYASPVMANGPPSRGATAVVSEDPPMDGLSVAEVGTGKLTALQKLALTEINIVQSVASCGSHSVDSQDVGTVIAMRPNIEVAIEVGCRPAASPGNHAEGSHRAMWQPPMDEKKSLTEINRIAASRRWQVAKDSSAVATTDEDESVVERTFTIRAPTLDLDVGCRSLKYALTVIRSPLAEMGAVVRRFLAGGEWRGENAVAMFFGSVA